MYLVVIYAQTKTNTEIEQKIDLSKVTLRVI